MPPVARALAVALLGALALSTAAAAQPTTFTQVVSSQESYGSGSCSGEIVDFTGAYHEVVHYQLDAEGRVTNLNILTGESNYGVGIGEESGDRYVRVYHQNSVFRADYNPYTETAVGTYLTRVLHLGPDDELLGDMWIRSTVHYVWTPEGFVRYTDNFASDCF
jgi:hypothetical protein